jgi:hypothetical protein
MSDVITGIQQIGIGVTDADEAKFYLLPAQCIPCHRSPTSHNCAAGSTDHISYFIKQCIATTGMYNMISRFSKNSKSLRVYSFV